MNLVVACVIAVFAAAGFSTTIQTRSFQNLSWRTTAAGGICGALALILSPLANQLIVSSSSVTLPSLSASSIAITLGIATTFGGCVALLCSLPGIATTVISALLNKSHRTEAAIIRAGTLLCSSILIMLFWNSVFDTLIRIVSDGLQMGTTPHG